MKNTTKSTTNKLLTGVALALAISMAGTQAEEKTKLFEPYAPKPSGPSPSGWEVQMLKGSSIESKTTLRNGREIKVNAPAYEMVPAAGGIVMKEPGFDPALGNSQRLTIGALITEYSETADRLQKELEKTISEMDKALGAPKTSQASTNGSGAGTPAKTEDKKKKN
jgi:hypothetical protein